MGMNVQAALRNTVMALYSALLKSLRITQPILTPGINGVGIKIKSSVNDVVLSGGKKKGPGLSTFPSTAETHSEVPLSLFC